MPVDAFKTGISTFTSRGIAGLVSISNQSVAQFSKWRKYDEMNFVLTRQTLHDFEYSSVTPEFGRKVLGEYHDLHLSRVKMFLYYPL
jgi:hypothetical protein